MDTVSIKDFQKFDIRIGTVLEAEIPEWSHWVMKLKVDLGSEIGERTIFAGIMHFYKPEDLIGKQFPFVTNLEPKKIGPDGDYSQGMMLMGVEKSDKPFLVVEGEEIFEKPVTFSLSEKVPNGSRVS